MSPALESFLVQEFIEMNDQSILKFVTKKSKWQAYGKTHNTREEESLLENILLLFTFSLYNFHRKLGTGRFNCHGNSSVNFELITR